MVVMKIMENFRVCDRIVYRIYVIFTAFHPMVLISSDTILARFSSLFIGLIHFVIRRCSQKCDAIGVVVIRLCLRFSGDYDAILMRQCS